MRKGIAALWIGALWIGALPGVAGAQSLSGEYVLQSPAGPVTLVLEQAAGNRVTGVMRGVDGNDLHLQGELDSAGRLIGTITVGGGTGWFAAGLVEGELMLAVAEFDPSTGQPDMESGWSLTFERVGGAAGGQPGVVEDSPLIREWRQHLSGKRVSYRDSYDSGGLGGTGGYSMRWDAYLCDDGTLVFERGSTVTVDVGTAGRFSHGRGSTSGQWRLVEQMGQVFIVYQMADGTSDHGALRYENGATYLDRDRVYVTNENPYCP